MYLQFKIQKALKQISQNSPIKISHSRRKVFKTNRFLLFNTYYHFQKVLLGQLHPMIVQSIFSMWQTQIKVIEENTSEIIKF
jgi:hypothetical protein